MNRVDNFIKDIKNFFIPLMLLFCVALTGYACNEAGKKGQDKQSAAAETTPGIRAAAATMPCEGEQAKSASGKVKHACCKGAPSRSRLTAQLKKAP